MTEEILKMMDEIIDDMESKTPEQLFNDLYTESEHFRKQWDNFVFGDIGSKTESQE